MPENIILVFNLVSICSDIYIYILNEFQWILSVSYAAKMISDDIKAKFSDLTTLLCRLVGFCPKIESVCNNLHQ